MSIRPPVAKSIEKMFKVTVRIRTPILEVTSPSTSTGIQPAPTVAYTPIAEMSFWLPERCTAQDRANLQTLAFNAIDNDPFSAMIDNLEAVY
jgi:hypothetical protein